MDGWMDCIANFCRAIKYVSNDRPMRGDWVTSTCCHRSPGRIQKLHHVQLGEAVEGGGRRRVGQATETQLNNHTAIKIQFSSYRSHWKAPKTNWQAERHRVCSGPPSSDGECYMYPTPGDKPAPQTSGRSLPSTPGRPAPTEWRVNPAHGPCRKSKTNLDIWDNRNVNLQSKICEHIFIQSIVLAYMEPSNTSCILHN